MRRLLLCPSLPIVEKGSSTSTKPHFDLNGTHVGLRSAVEVPEKETLCQKSRRSSRDGRRAPTISDRPVQLPPFPGHETRSLLHPLLVRTPESLPETPSQDPGPDSFVPTSRGAPLGSDPPLSGSHHDLFHLGTYGHTDGSRQDRCGPTSRNCQCGLGPLLSFSSDSLPRSEWTLRHRRVWVDTPKARGPTKDVSLG